MILLTFNITDSAGYLNNKLKISNENLIAIITENTESVLRTLEPFDVSTTFFISSRLVSKLENLIKMIFRKGHEVALLHDGNWAETAEAQQTILRYLQKSVKGIRVQQDFSAEQIKSQQFVYVSPIEKVNITHLFHKISGRSEVYTENELEIIPQSFAPWSQLPYNETIFQYLPMKYYENMVYETLKSSDYVLIYLNILQFTDFGQHGIRMPFYHRYNTGKKLEDKLSNFLQWVNDNDMATSTVKDFLV